jgi:hypothetical protein
VEISYKLREKTGTGHKVGNNKLKEKRELFWLQSKWQVFDLQIIDESFLICSAPDINGNSSICKGA